jgi:hypothetical protein
MTLLAQLSQSGSTETNSFGSIVLGVAVLLVILGLASRKR